MILDEQNQYSLGQELTATAVSQNIIDHGVGSNIGIGEPMCILLTLDVAADGTTGDETYTAALQTDDNENFTSATQVGGTITITRGDPAGTRYVLSVPPDTAMEQYSRLYYTLGGTTPTVTVSAHLIPQQNMDNYISYANGFAIT